MTPAALVLTCIAGVPLVLLAGAFLAWGIGPWRYGRNTISAKSTREGIASTIVWWNGRRLVLAPKAPPRPAQGSPMRPSRWRGRP